MSARRGAGGGLVAAVEVDRGVTERGEPGDVGGVWVVPVGGEVVEGRLGVHGLPQHNYVDHEAEGVELVFLPDLVVLAELAALAVEDIAGQAVAGFAAFEQVVDAAVLQYVQGFDHAAVADALGYHPVTTAKIATQVGVTWSRYAPGDPTRIGDS